MKSRLLLLFATLAITAAACGGDDDPGTQPPTGMNDGGTDTGTIVVPPDGSMPDAGAQLFTDFVKDIIAKDTNETLKPRTTEDKTFAPDPEDKGAFPAAFF
jgi:hypothetical protein